jgi:ABC-2 type transport system ATP-binding protein
LVTHDMGTVQHFCDRAMLIHDGDMRFLGDPEEAALEYFRLNFRGEGDAPTAGGTVPDINVKVRRCWLEDGDGQRIENAEQGVPIRFNLVVEARYDLREPVFNFHVVNDEGIWVFGFGKTLKIDLDDDLKIEQGRRIRISAELENPLLPGAYSVECWMSRQREVGDMGLHVFRLLDFHVFGTKPGHGSVYARSEIETSIESVAKG